MIRKVFLVAVVALISVMAFVLLAPQAPEGSWVSDAGMRIADGVKAFWGNPVAP
ncbi:MAG: hypothetical protein ACXW15_13050 [Acidimicrobiia bacterium]